MTPEAVYVVVVGWEQALRRAIIKEVVHIQAVEQDVDVAPAEQPPSV